MPSGLINIVLVCAAILVLLYALEVIIHRSFAGAIQGLNAALRAELKSDCGRINFVVVILMLFVFLFTHLEDWFGKVLAKSGTLSPDRQSAISPLVLGLFFMGSVFFVGVLEGTKAVNSARRPRKKE